MGMPDSKVECSLDGGEFTPMSYVADADPLFLDALHRYDFTETQLTGRRPSNAEKSTHLFRSPIPNNLTVGEHKVTIRATDLYGKTFTEETSFKVL